MSAWSTWREFLERRGVSLGAFGPDERALGREDALRVVDLVESEGDTILGGHVYVSQGGRVVTKTRLLTAVHIPAGDGVLENDGAVMVEVEVEEAGGEFPFELGQIRDGDERYLWEVEIRQVGRPMNEWYGVHTREGLAIDRSMPFVMVGVIRGYWKDLPLLGPGGGMRLAMSARVPKHLQSYFDYMHTRKAMTCDYD